MFLEIIFFLFLGLFYLFLGYAFVVAILLVAYLTKQGKYFDRLVVPFLTQPFGVAIGLIFVALKKLGIIKVIHMERIPIEGKRIFVVNHPSVIDPFLIVALLIASLGKFVKFLWKPFEKRPTIMADKKLFYDPWYFFGLRPALIPVERGDRRKEAVSLIQVAKAVEEEKPVIVFPEGGRTFKGNRDEVLYSAQKKELRPFKGGVGLLASRTGALIVPIWIEGTDHVVPNSHTTLWTKLNVWRLLKKGITIKIGQPIDPKNFSERNREEITQIIVISLLKLADEAE